MCMCVCVYVKAKNEMGKEIVEVQNRDLGVTCCAGNTAFS